MAASSASPAPGTRQSAKLVAVIDIGATAVRMAIAEIDADANVRTLESLTQAVSLGKDTFTRGSIDPATTEACVKVLTSYRELLNQYEITTADRIQVVATSAVREASNRVSFLNRIYVATGFKVEPFDEAAVNRVTYLGVQPLLERDSELKDSQALIVEVGGGSTEVLLLQKGDVAYADIFRLGALRLRKTLQTFRAPIAKVRSIMESQIDRIVGPLRRHIDDSGPLQMLALGGDVRFAVTQHQPDWNSDQLATLPLERLRQFADDILSLSIEEVVHRYHLSFTDAEALGPALLAYVQIAKALGLDNVRVASINLRDGLIKGMAFQEAFAENFTAQILRSALDLGRRFRFDEDHGRHVAELCSTLFDALQEQHQLDKRHGLLLLIAGLLHDVGYVISGTSHHKHSMYLINHGELFGLSRKDAMLIALTARYHRRATPKPTHEGFAMLDFEDRISVAKMAAILRVADALDRSNCQRIKNIRCEIEDNRMIVSVPSADDLSLEQLALRQKATMFKEVYGMTVLVRSSLEV